MQLRVSHHRSQQVWHRTVLTFVTAHHHASVSLSSVPATAVGLADSVVAGGLRRPKSRNAVNFIELRRLSNASIEVGGCVCVVSTRQFLTSAPRVGHEGCRVPTRSALTSASRRAGAATRRDLTAVEVT